ncbi:class I SAM-dependent methyltransferase [Anaerosacchariphilus polymeriproducens]|uniref:Class I SAM-dependent methyltransferase n=1 Tax=Anaerosacchariphilus polymeriproducens TaxID=1812858 RepID=A0A371AXF2_9FIRM|nr:class I SAM-dependent methyltransferase [Anaerosacchariphilus polymeriproducens]RDU24255.1 class I SAM-dependent methyltransferase [Anaerosacchariphilus polymeriproducens]
MEFSYISKNIFYPIYSVIAKQILQYQDVDKNGICLDIGCGPGYLGMSIVKKTNMKLCLFDLDSEVLKIAEQTIEEANLNERAYTCHGNVEDMPFRENYFDLVISRGSLFFWEDKLKAMNEIFRVLKPGGCAYIGGGFGTKELKKIITSKMQEIDETWLLKVKERRGRIKNYREIVEKSRVNTYEIINDETGYWIILKK